MKIIFAGTPGFALPALQALIDSHDVIAVFTQPDRRSGRGKKITPPPVKELAQTHDIAVFQPTNMREASSLIEGLSADFIVVVAYGMLLTQSVLDTPKFACINIHASLLPRWRGAAPIQRAIESGDKTTGVSIMKMELGLDTGPVYKTLRCPIAINDTSASLHDKLAHLGAQGLIDTLSLFNDEFTPSPQTQTEDGSNYAKKITKAEAEIDWTLSARELHAKIRAFIPWPICQTTHTGNRLRIWQSSLPETTEGLKAHDTQPGTIVWIDTSGIHVACGKGVLQLETLQRDGSRELQSKEFCNGYHLAIGDQLGVTSSNPNNNSF
jgi:methionyl-tRNA formyltransferase